MPKIFGKKISKKSLYITLAVSVILAFGVFFGANFFQKFVLNRIDFSDFVALGNIGQNIDETKDNLNSYVAPKVYDDDMCVHFLNVGKADCAYIRCKNVNILIDAADREPAGFVVEYLKRQKVEKLDMVVMTHPHRDHIGQMAQVIKEFKVNKFIETDMPKDIIPTTWTYEKMLKALIDENVPVESIMAGDDFKMGDLKIKVLGPVRISKENMNDNSLVMKITYKDVSFLFTGDAARSEENDILKHYGLQSGSNSKNYSYNYNNYRRNYNGYNWKKHNYNGYNYNNRRRYNYVKYENQNSFSQNNILKSNVLKVGHHGSNSSSTTNFLNLVKPDYAVVSTASKESMGLPSNWRWRALERLQKCCNKIYKTYESGNIVFLTDGKTIKVETEK